MLQTLQAKNQERRFVGCHYFIFNDLRRGRDSEFLSANRRVIQVGRWLGTHFHFKELQKDSPFALVPILQWISDRILPTLLAVTIQSHFESQPDSKMPCGVANQQQSQQMLMNPSQSGYFMSSWFQKMKLTFLSEQEIWKYRSYIWGRLSNMPKLKVLPCLSRKSRTWHFCQMTALATVNTHGPWHELLIFFLQTFNLIAPLAGMCE